MNKVRFCDLNYGKIYRQFSYKSIKRPNHFSDKKKTAPNLADDSSRSETLFNQLRAKIMTNGPLTVAEYMKEVLTNPNGGYYMSRDVFGTDGDFITSPEIGQIFGELVAIWCLTEWQKIGSPSPFQIVELGPGRGTLARDILKVFTHFKLGKHFSFHLVEVSPYLSKIQAQRLCFKHDEVDESPNELFYRYGETLTGAKVYWYRRLEDVPRNFSILLAHEFFDALPIHKLQNDQGVWKEVLIDVDPQNLNALRYCISRSQTPISKIFKKIKGDDRLCLEYSLETHLLIKSIAERFETDGGIGLIMDYGHFGEKADTFRAFKNHKLHDPLIQPGTADLTADVDFKHMKHIAEENGKVITFGPIEQTNFLRRMEGEARLKVLMDFALPENVESIKSGYEMLTDPKQMGSRFKFFSIFPAVLKDHLTKFPVSGFS